MKRLLALLLCLGLLFSLAACELDTSGSTTSSSTASGDTPETAQVSAEFDYSEIPDWTGTTYYVVNNNAPYFTEDELTTENYEYFSPLDSLGRCGTCVGCLDETNMPTGEREDIRSVKPTGWQHVEYDFVDQLSLYNRSHLLAYMLTGENANPQNLITGTRYLNYDGMLPFENLVGDYIRETGNHVLYRVTPVFEGEDLIARGVLMEAESVEDQGEGVYYCVWIWNVQPGVGIDYATGDNWEEDNAIDEDDVSGSYVLNTNSHKFHNIYCEGVQNMNEANKKNYTGLRESLLDDGYTPCPVCTP